MPGASGGFGLWDDTHGGYYQGIVLTGASIPSLTGYTLSSNYKEVGRGATMVRAFIACNQALGDRYPAAIAPVLQSVVSSFYKAGQGWPYEEADDFSLYTSNGVADDWVTSESTGHAARALLSAEAF